MKARHLIPSILAVAAILPLANPASAREPTQYTPTSQWNMNYQEDTCVLLRQFSDGENELTLQIEQTSAVPFYNLTLLGDAVKRTRSAPMEISFGPNEGVSERSFLTGEIEATDAPFILMHGIHLAPAVESDAENGEFAVVDIGTERERAITQLTLKRGIRRPIQLQIGPMDRPLDAMRACVENLVATLKLDADGLSEVVQGPVPKNQHQLARFIQERYPTQQLMDGEGGTVAVQLTVNREGQVTACQIAKSNRPAVFDDYVCFGMLRMAEFEPARGPDGEPRYGIYSTRVTYRVH